MRSSLCARAQDDRESCALKGLLSRYGEDDHDECLARGCFALLQCRLRVKNDGSAMPALLPLYARKPTFIVRNGMSEKCHVWTAPGWQGFSSRLQHWSVRPCVRPVSAVHMTAGHNALRGSGPGQLHAFDHAVARVGCPDRRIDRLCITCCSPFPTVHITPDARRDLFHAASATGSL